MSKKIYLIVLFNLIMIISNAQTNNSKPIDFMNSEGKIFVVVAVVLVILFGLFYYVWRLDKKISKLEKSKK